MGKEMNISEKGVTRGEIRVVRCTLKNSGAESLANWRRRGRRQFQERLALKDERGVKMGKRKAKRAGIQTGGNRTRCLLKVQYKNIACELTIPAI